MHMKISSIRFFKRDDRRADRQAKPSVSSANTHQNRLGFEPSRLRPRRRLERGALSWSGVVSRNNRRRARRGWLRDLKNVGALAVRLLSATSRPATNRISRIGDDRRSRHPHPSGRRFSFQRLTLCFLSALSLRHARARAPRSPWFSRAPKRFLSIFVSRICADRTGASYFNANNGPGERSFAARTARSSTNVARPDSQSRQTSRSSVEIRSSPSNLCVSPQRQNVQYRTIHR